VVIAGVRPLGHAGCIGMGWWVRGPNGGIDGRPSRRLSSARRFLRGRNRPPLHPHAQQGPDAPPETAAKKAPPEGADHHRDRVAAGQGGTEETAHRPQDQAAEPESQGDPVESAAEGVPASLLSVRAIGPCAILIGWGGVLWTWVQAVRGR
jgi:hypothetical protein